MSDQPKPRRTLSYRARLVAHEWGKGAGWHCSAPHEELGIVHDHRCDSLADAIEGFVCDRITALEADVARLTASLAERDRQVGEWIERGQFAEAKAQHLAERLGSVANYTLDLVGVVAHADMRLVDAEAEAAALRARYDQLKRDVRERVTALEAENARLTDQVDRLSGAMTTIEDAREEGKRDADAALRARVVELEASVVKLSGQLLGERCKTAELEGRLAESIKAQETT